MSFLGLLTLLFIGLKLGGVITWSWVWVLAPLWIPTAIAGVVLAVVLIAMLVTYLTERMANKDQHGRGRTG